MSFKYFTFLYPILGLLVLLAPTQVHAQAVKYTSNKAGVWSFSPTAVGLAGGHPVTIKGSGFVKDSLPTILFGGVGVPANQITFVSSTQLTVLAQAVSAPDSVKIYVINNGASDTLPSYFNYAAAKVSNIS